jgi:hypothetical protein
MITVLFVVFGSVCFFSFAFLMSLLAKSAKDLAFLLVLLFVFVHVFSHISKKVK